MSNQCRVPSGTPIRSPLLAQHLVDLVADVQRELAGAGDEEAHLVLRVRVFVEKLRAQRGAVGMIRGEADHVDALVALFAHQAVDIAAVGGDHVVLARARHDRLGRFPLLEAHADLRQFARDPCVLGVHRERRFPRGLPRRCAVDS